MTKEKWFRVRIEDRNGLFVATSPDLKGMLVAERSLDALKAAIPSQVADLFAACGVEALAEMIDARDSLSNQIATITAERDEARGNAANAVSHLFNVVDERDALRARIAQVEAALTAISDLRVDRDNGLQELLFKAREIALAALTR